MTSIKGQIEVIETVKADVLQGDIDCPGVVASRIYDTIPVHFLSMRCNLIKWFFKSNKLYKVDSVEVEQMDFLRLNHIYDYNNAMGLVDIAYQLRGKY